MDAAEAVDGLDVGRIGDAKDLLSVAGGELNCDGAGQETENLFWDARS